MVEPDTQNTYAKYYTPEHRAMVKQFEREFSEDLRARILKTALAQPFKHELIAPPIDAANIARKASKQRISHA